MLIQNVNLPSFAEAKVGNAPGHQDSTQKQPAGRPDMNAITAPAVHITIHVAFDAIRYADLGKCKETSVREERLPVIMLHVKGITERICQTTSRYPKGKQ